MKIDVVTIFPDLITANLAHGILRRAHEAGQIEVTAHDLRDHTHDRHRSTDDTPYGGGAGMVMKPAPIFDCVEALNLDADTPVILLTPQGRPFTQAIARELSTHSKLVMLCGRYEGFDERVRTNLATDEISVGDFVLTGGELAALIVIDAVIRLIPGVLGSGESTEEESFSDGLLEYPHFTRPPDFRGWTVPDVLLSGNHAEIAKWRRKEQFRRTRERRPDLWAKFVPSKSDLKLLKELTATDDLPEQGKEYQERIADASADSRD
jgi:tRNA (guanine37-N1)-methyltransferase